MAKTHMSPERTSQALRELAAEASQRSKAQFLARVLPDVEAALAAGASRAEVLRRLSDSGLQMSPAAFGSALARLRRRQRSAPPQATAEPRPPSVAVDLSPALPSPAIAGSVVAGGSPVTMPDFAALRTQSHDLEALAQKHRERRRRERSAAPNPETSGGLKVPERWKSKLPPG